MLSTASVVQNDPTDARTWPQGYQGLQSLSLKTYRNSDVVSLLWTVWVWIVNAVDKLAVVMTTDSENWTNNPPYLGSIGVARGCSGCTCTPRAEKNFRHNLQEKFVRAHPQVEQESIFRTFFAERGRVGASVSSCRPSFETKATTLKRSPTFLRKSAPQTKSCYAWKRCKIG